MFKERNFFSWLKQIYLHYVYGLAMVTRKSKVKTYVNSPALTENYDRGDASGIKTLCRYVLYNFVKWKSFESRSVTEIPLLPKIFSIDLITTLRSQNKHEFWLAEKNRVKPLNCTKISRVCLCKNLIGSRKYCLKEA